MQHITPSMVGTREKMVFLGSKTFSLLNERA